MTYRGIYRGGVVVPGDSLDLPEGARIEFDIVRCTPFRGGKRPGPARASARGSPKMSADQRIAAFMTGFGLARGQRGWKGKSSAAITRELRERALGSWGSFARG